MSDDPNRPDADHELDVDLSAFLPEGSHFATDDAETDDKAASADGWDTGAPAPEIPEWARDDLPPPPVVDGPAQSVDDVSEPASAADVGPAVAAAPEVDTTVLTRIEGELADVDAAIAAIDTGDLARSPLLSQLLAADATPPIDSGSSAPPEP